MPLELQTKWLVSCNGFVKVDSDKVNFFNRKKTKNINKEDKELFNFLDKIRNKNKLPN